MSLLCLSRTTVVAVNSPHLWCSPLICVSAFTKTIYSAYGKHVHMREKWNWKYASNYSKNLKYLHAYWGFQQSKERCTTRGPLQQQLHCFVSGWRDEVKDGVIGLHTPYVNASFRRNLSPTTRFCQARCGTVPAVIAFPASCIPSFNFPSIYCKGFPPVSRPGLSFVPIIWYPVLGDGVRSSLQIWHCIIQLRLPITTGYSDDKVLHLLLHYICMSFFLLLPPYIPATICPPTQHFTL